LFSASLETASHEDNLMNLLRLTLLTAALLTASAAQAGEAIDETREVAADALIDIEVTNGIITLTGWDRNQFHIEGELSDAAEGYELREVNGGIRFSEDIDRPDRRGCWGWRGCNNNNRGNLAVLEIQMPRNSVLRFEGVNAEVSASGLTGNTEIEVVNGELTVTDLSGIVKLETVNGSIDATNLDGRVTLETVNGSIDDRGSRGSRISLATTNGSVSSNTRSPRVNAETVNGDIELTLGELDELELSTVGGRLEIAAALNPGALLDISSVGGRVDLTLPADSSARFRIATAVGGRITNQLSDDQPVRKSRYVNSSELNFSINGGDADVHISTVSGNVTLRDK
jgi:hypothetical protein